MGNTVGSSNLHFWNFWEKKDGSYILGLWCADGYHRTSSIGISNNNLDIINRFHTFLLGSFEKDRIKVRVYFPVGSKINIKLYQRFSNHIVSYPMEKCSRPALQLYVNSRPLLRLFRQARNSILDLRKKLNISAYFAGRFDGDGSIASDMRSDCRIVYSNLEEAKSDQELLQSAGFSKSKVYVYKKAKTFCLYISRYETKKFIDSIKKYSIKLVPKM